MSRKSFDTKAAVYMGSAIGVLAFLMRKRMTIDTTQSILVDAPAEKIGSSFLILNKNYWIKKLSLLEN